MGILSIINRNLLHSSKSKLLKSLSPSIPRLSAKTQVCAPMFGGDVSKHMFLIQHYKEDVNPGSAYYSLVSTKEKSWKLENYEIPDHRIPSGRVHFGCNGLYLSLILKRGGEDAPAEHLWNPITNEIKALPPPGPSCFSCGNSYGMWFDPESNDYKVIRFLRSDPPHDPLGTVVEIYSLKTDSWRQIAYPLTCFGPSIFNSVCVNGILYGATYDGDANVILSFDFAKEEFSPALIPLPEKVRPTRGWEIFDYRLVDF